MSEWSVYIKVGGREAVDVDALVEALEPVAGVVGVGPDTLDAQVSVDGETVLEAAAKAVEALERAAGDLPDVVRLEISSVDELEAELERPIYPELVGVTEAAAILGVTKQRVSTMYRADRLPSPVEVLAAGPVWTADAIEAFDKTWTRRSGRPPAKATA